MPKGPPVHEIFNPPSTDKAVPFHYEKRESKASSQLTAKKTFAPQPPMKKFGGYKPKILGNNDDIIPVTSSNKPAAPEPPTWNNRRPVPVLSKPKPFIIGDKNTPMVLSTADDNDSDSNSNDLHNGFDEVHIYEEPPMYMRRDGNSREMNNNNINNNNNMSSNFGTSINPYNTHIESDFEHSLTFSQSSSDNGAFIVANENDGLVNKNNAKNDPSTFAAENPVFNNSTDTLGTTATTDESRIESEPEPEGVFIPAPDYDEEEQTMEFDDEDPEEMAEIQRKAQIEKQQRLQRLQQQQNDGTRMKVYDGEDLSKYLSDDEDEFINNGNNTMPMRLNQKHSLFKTNPHNTTGKQRKAYNKKQAPKFNSVRNFSFADSKYGTSGKASGKKMTVSGGDYESFLSTSQQGEGYENFLTSKHGVESHGYQPQYHGKSGDGIWKKLTVRLKHKMQKNGNAYDMQEQF